MIAMWVAAERPERVGRLVLCCTSAYLDAAAAYTSRAAKVRAEGTGSVADAVVARWFTPGYAARQPDRVAEMRAMFAATPSEGYAGCCEALAVMDLRPHLAAIRATTLLIAGGDDPAIPPEHSHRIAAEVAGARVEIVPDAAHLANVEQPERVTGLIMSHLGAAGRLEEP
jgi:3-oxoadipate enol-lactonase